jgi:hypothetical protein
MKAGQHAVARVQGPDRLDAAAKADVQVQRGLAGRMVLQQRQRVVMAGMQHQHQRLRVEGQRQRALEFGAQGLDLRPEPGLGQPFAPEQPVGKRGQPGRLAALPEDQVLLQGLLPVLQLAPDMAVGQAELARRARDRAAVAHGQQQLEQRVADQGGRLAFAAQPVTEFYLAHVATVCPIQARRSACLCSELHNLDPFARAG